MSKDLFIVAPCSRFPELCESGSKKLLRLKKYWTENQNQIGCFQRNAVLVPDGKIKSGQLSAVHIDGSVGVNGNIGRRNNIAPGIHHISHSSSRQNYKNDKQIGKNFQTPKNCFYKRQKLPVSLFPVCLSGRQFLLSANTD